MRSGLLRKTVLGVEPGTVFWHASVEVLADEQWGYPVNFGGKLRLYELVSENQLLSIPFDDII